MMDFIRKHRNPLLLLFLVLTLTVSYFAAQQRLMEASATVSLPVEQVSEPTASAFEAFRARRETTQQQDMASLRALCDQEALSAETRESAAAQLQQLIAQSEAQLALEGALTASGVAPCVAVVSQGSVTIVTEQESISDAQSALILNLVQSHTGVAPSGVRVMSAQN